MNNLELKALRQSVGISQATMAAALGVSRAQYIRYEAGERKRPDGTVAPTGVPGPVAKLAALVVEGYKLYDAEVGGLDDEGLEAEDTVEEMEAAQRAVEEEGEGATVGYLVDYYDGFKP